VSARDETTHVRLRKATVAKLKEIRDRLIASQEAGLRNDLDVNPEPINPRGSGLSIDQVILALIAEREGHLARARTARAKRKSKRDDG